MIRNVYPETCAIIEVEGESISHSRDMIVVAEGQWMPPYLPPSR